MTGRNGAVPSCRRDLDPENDEFIDGSFSLLADHGRHPGFYIDFCEVGGGLLPGLRQPTKPAAVPAAGTAAGLWARR